MDKCDSQRNMSITLTLFKETLCNMYNLSLPAPPQPFHARGRFELVAGCMGKKGRGLVKKRQQATETHHPTVSG